MEFYLGERRSEEDLEGETSGKFIEVMKMGVHYLIPIAYAPEKKMLATYLKGYLRTSETPYTASMMRIHMLIHTRHSVHLATTLIPTLEELQKDGWSYLSETDSTASGSS
jgi:hypothetical protein